MNGLALCAGIGGLELGVRLAVPKYRAVVYVEREAYAATTLVARMADSSLGPAPIWDDLRTFDARPWRGVVDIVTAGFPCQPWSAAGRRRGVKDDAWLWPQICRILGECRPSAVFLENSPRLDVRHLLKDLARLRFDAAWDRFSAAQSGAPHRRQRLFLLAYANGFRVRVQRGRSGRSSGEDPDESTRDIWRSGEPGIPRVDDGTPDRAERARAVGNAVVPVVAARAFNTLNARLQ